MHPVFKNYGFLINGITHVTPKEAYELNQKGVTILDVREMYEIKYKMLSAQHLLIIPFPELEESLSCLPADMPVIIADAVGVRSKMAIEFLIRKGYQNVVNMAGGILEWEKDGLPIIKDMSVELNDKCACMLNTWNKLKNK